MSVDVYTCKRFATKAAVAFTKQRFELAKIAWKVVVF